MKTLYANIAGRKIEISDIGWQLDVKFHAVDDIHMDRGSFDPRTMRSDYNEVVELDEVTRILLNDRIESKKQVFRDEDDEFATASRNFFVSDCDYRYEEPLTNDF